MKEFLSFDDVLITPKFSKIKSRKYVSPTNDFGNIPIISSNMDTVTDAKMATKMSWNNALGCLHRFCSIDDNVKMFQDSPKKTIVSFGLGTTELDRAKALYHAGAEYFVLDVAHGANLSVVEQVKEFRKIYNNNASLMVGNFSTAQSINDFYYHLGSKDVESFKIGIGSGSACTTRIVTGCGVPLFGSILDCSTVGIPIIADGGIRNSGDYAKALGAGAAAVMIGRLFAATEESPTDVFYKKHDTDYLTMDEVYKINNYKFSDFKKYKKYRGSASKESYLVQGKVSDHRTPEGDAYYVPCTGPLRDVIQELDAGLRSAMSYVGAFTLQEFKEKVEFIKITQGGAIESTPHGKQST